ncbi:hypothetical protein EDD18DRAFT_1105267 [Armillaria luteobubalina]|uniref:Uncharacterized protein n=1 Tax=Armillaria luteobubalina TaxID=153913 RepID=A0AA39UPH3_9AGAR|nr:hypothetical protein EDD18DRAFT_1105267 [Armillaria luteobubalina]
MVLTALHVSLNSQDCWAAGDQWSWNEQQGMGCNDVKDLYVRQSLLLCFSIFCLSPLKVRWSIIVTGGLNDEEEETWGLWADLEGRPGEMDGEDNGDAETDGVGTE